MKDKEKIHSHKHKPYRGISHCKSLSHSLWFRIILVLVAISMIVFGFTYAMGIDILSFLPHPSFTVRFIIGILYIITALFVIHYVFEYERGKEEFHYICYRCLPGELNKGESGTDEEEENEDGE